MKRRIFALLFSLALCLNLLIPMASATSKTPDDAINWVKSQLGQSLDMDGAYGAQCVDLILAYYDYLGVPRASGNGCDYAWNALPSGWQRLQGAQPQKGDILIYSGSASNPFGHVAIYESDNSHYHQNFDGKSYVCQATYSYNGLSEPYWGVIRPNWSDGGAPAAAENITLDFPWIGFTEDTNAQIGSFIRNGGAAVGVPTFGLQVWEKSTGERIVDHSENISGSIQQMTEIKIWVNLTDELGVKLKPGTEYEFQFSATKGGKTYYSDKNTFKTTGQAPNTTVTFVFDPGDGSGSMASISASLDGELTLPKCTFTPPAGMKFYCWQSPDDVSWFEGNTSTVKVFARDAQGGKTYTFTAVWMEDRTSQPVPSVTYSAVHFSHVNVYHQGQFTDVPANQWYTEAVASAFELGLMKGDSATTFNPHGDVTIAEAVTMACRLHAIYTTGYESAIVSTPGAWYQPYLEYARSNGIINDAYYNSDVTQVATRAQFAEIFANSLPDEALRPINTVADNKIPDVPMSAYYADAVYKLYRAGILTGGDVYGSFSPSSFITRKEAATLISRMAESDNRKFFTL